MPARHPRARACAAALALVLAGPAAAQEIDPAAAEAARTSALNGTIVERDAAIARRNAAAPAAYEAEQARFVAADAEYRRKLADAERADAAYRADAADYQRNLATWEANNAERARPGKAKPAPERTAGATARAEAPTCRPVSETGTRLKRRKVCSRPDKREEREREEIGSDMRRLKFKLDPPGQSTPR